MNGCIYSLVSLRSRQRINSMSLMIAYIFDRQLLYVLFLSFVVSNKMEIIFASINRLIQCTSKRHDTLTHPPVTVTMHISLLFNQIVVY